MAGAPGGPTVPIEAVPGSGVTKFKKGGVGPFIWWGHRARLILPPQEDGSTVQCKHPNMSLLYLSSAPREMSSTRAGPNGVTYYHDNHREFDTFAINILI